MLEQQEVRVRAPQTCSSRCPPQTSWVAEPHPQGALGFPSGDSHIPHPKWETLPLRLASAWNPTAGTGTAASLQSQGQQPASPCLPWLAPFKCWCKAFCPCPHTGLGWGEGLMLCPAVALTPDPSRTALGSSVNPLAAGHDPRTQLQVAASWGRYTRARGLGHLCGGPSCGR